MGITKKLGNVLFWLTLISPIVSFYLASEIGEADIFGVGGIVRYSWIMLLFIPIGILSILIGVKLKKDNQKYMKNIVIACICLPLLLIWGSYVFLFTNVTYDVNKIHVVESKTNLELPNEIKIATVDLDIYDISYAKILDEKDKETFERELRSSQLWQKQLNADIKQLLPKDIQYIAETYDIFVFYNTDSKQYNSSFAKGECVFIAYNYEFQKLMILDNYKI